ncbi:neutral zinc metallopeptidase [Spirillospora sp. CA-294931]|uniref:neutral zinc metallopeptidase n=1 Tax=Spirillospora sp. CA-294931 TaxID=3240042 RepID=UPI003D94352C
MTGHSPPPALARPQGSPVHDPYRHGPARRPPRRTAGGAIAGLVGTLAALAVAGILGYTALGPDDGARGTGLRSERSVSREAATRSPLYATGTLTPVKCRLSVLSPGTASMRRFMDGLSDCLDASWEKQFGKARMEFERPKRVFWDQPGRSPCGTYPSPGTSAFYCPANGTMYVGLRHIVETSGGEPLAHSAVFARVIAHEYAHHVQERAGILAYGQREMERTSGPPRAEASRRIELQAQCLAGAFLGAERATLPMTRRQYTAMINDVRGRGDEHQAESRRDHGSSRNYAGWVVRGYRDERPAACNTWTASSAAVG